MDTLPRAVLRTLKQLKEERGHYIRAFPKNSHFYAVEYLSVGDDEHGHRQTTRYIGRIMRDGSFVSAEHHLKGSHIRRMKLQGSVKETIEHLSNEYKNINMMRDQQTIYLYDIESGKSPVYIGWLNKDGVLHPPSEPIRRGAISFESYQNFLNRSRSFDESDRKILTILSMNARSTNSFIAERIGLSPVGVRYRINRLNKKFGIKYTSEFDLTKLGFLSFLVFVKFDDKIPQLDKLSQILADEPKIQFACITKGVYDLVIYLLEEDTNKVAITLWKLRHETILSEYNARWQVSPFYDEYSFVPLRDEFFEKVVKQKEWRRTRENPSRGRGDFLGREIAVMREFNKNSTLDFSDIDSKYNLSKGSSRYTFEKLRRDGIIKRTTITMTGTEVKYYGIMLIEFINTKKFSATQYELLLETIRNNQFTNKYALGGDIGTPGGIIMFMPVLSQDELDKTVEHLKSVVQGVWINVLIATDVLLGNLCLRMFDNAYSLQQEMLESMNKAQPQKKVAYN